MGSVIGMLKPLTCASIEIPACVSRRDVLDPG